MERDRYMRSCIYVDNIDVCMCGYVYIYIILSICGQANLFKLYHVYTLT